METTFIKARDRMYDDRIFQTFTLCIVYNNKIQTTFGPPYPTHQTSTQDPISDKSQAGGFRTPFPSCGSAHDNINENEVMKMISSIDTYTKIVQYLKGILNIYIW